jgi:hypothetical protein
VFSSPPISQQQNCWFNHQASEQYPIFMSDSHSVTIEIIAALSPMQTPEKLDSQTSQMSLSLLTNETNNKPALSCINQLPEVRPKP